MLRSYQLYSLRSSRRRSRSSFVGTGTDWHSTTVPQEQQTARGASRGAHAPHGVCVQYVQYADRRRRSSGRRRRSSGRRRRSFGRRRRSSGRRRQSSQAAVGELQADEGGRLAAEGGPQAAVLRSMRSSLVAQCSHET